MPQNMMKNIKWLGHAGFSINADGVHLVIDPFEAAECEPADILLITHPHYDHCSMPDVERIQKESTIIVTEADAAKQLAGDIRVVKPGDTLTIEGIDIEAVAAYNTNKPNHPQENGWLGFIIDIQGVRIYHAGDADLIPEMDQIKADIALLPVSGTYVMDASEAIEAARRIQPKIAVPMHYDAIVGSKKDAVAFKEALADICEVRILSK